MKKTSVVLVSFFIVLFLVGFIFLCARADANHKPTKPKNYKYKVISVCQYVKNSTNQFGGITKTEVVYYFTYIDKDGKLYHVQAFAPSTYGTQKLHIGKKDTYIKKNGEMHLYLTKKTFKKLTKGVK